HAVNPYGMATMKRTNAANVDLNRNSLTDYKIQNPEFADFNEFLRHGAVLDFLKTIPSIFRLGTEKTARSVACGQSDFPDSLFYCGPERQPELAALKNSLQLLIDAETKVFVLDVHTGLGRKGSESLLIENFEGKDEEKFRSIFNQDLKVPDRDSDFYRASGTLNHLFSESWKALHCFQEFGTRPFYQVLLALIHQKPEQMLNAFFPDDGQWRKRCVDLGLLRFRQLVQNLS
ncbi:MAG: DUF2817 domain-containing protein, partial [Pseudobdellovibrionaceae bacterium]